MNKIFGFLKTYIKEATICGVVAVALVFAIACAVISSHNKKSDLPTEPSEVQTEVSSESEVSSEIQESSETVESSEPESKPEESKPTESKPVASNPASTSRPAAQPAPSWQCSDVHHNGNVDINNNIFMDSLGYTGYNLEKHRNDGMMWKYVLSSQKRGTGWLSNITYGGGSTGYETTSDGKPDIAKFERGGLVCASYVTYVYFNYVPNVCGIDVSHLTKPEKSYLAHDWYVAAKDWVANGYSKKIDFYSSGKAGNFMKFVEYEEIPIGSLICLRDGRSGYENSDHCTHVCIYAGYENGYHWVYHVGNSNGPEFCAIERMLFGPDPQAMLAVFTTPFAY